jgi:carbamoyltransferase
MGDSVARSKAMQVRQIDRFSSPHIEVWLPAHDSASVPIILSSSLELNVNFHIAAVLRGRTTITDELVIEVSFTNLQHSVPIVRTFRPILEKIGESRRLEHNWEDAAIREQHCGSSFYRTWVYLQGLQAGSYQFRAWFAEDSDDGPRLVSSVVVIPEPSLKASIDMEQRSDRCMVLGQKWQDIEISEFRGGIVRFNFVPPDDGFDCALPAQHLEQHSVLNRSLAQIKHKWTSLRVVAIHPFHDANLCLSVGGKVEFVLELERLFGTRHFSSTAGVYEIAGHGTYHERWRRVHRSLQAVLHEPLSEHVDVLVQIRSFPRFPSWIYLVPAVIVGAYHDVYVQHHRSHASYALHTSPFEHSIILSYDGGGQEGAFVIFSARRSTGELLFINEDGTQFELDLGATFMNLASMIPALANSTTSGLSLPGKMMAYAAYGEVVPAIYELIYTAFTSCSYYCRDAQENEWHRLLLAYLRSNGDFEQHWRDFAHTVQQVFEDVVINYLRTYASNMDDVEGLIMTGGCALNVRVNSRIQRELYRRVFVPSSPEDSSLSIGASWQLQPPPERPLFLEYGGLLPFDAGDFHSLVADWDAQLVTISAIAEELAQGHVLALIIGRQEVGPRALGHRSLLGYPRKPGLRSTLNAIKQREWFRPIAPAIPVDSLSLFFEDAHTIDSPFMSFAPTLRSARPDAAQIFGAIGHVDGTARVQTVSAESESFFFALLHAVGQLTSWPVLANTSLNVRGRPIVNSFKAAIEIVMSTPAIYALVADGWLFHAPDSAPS